MTPLPGVIANWRLPRSLHSLLRNIYQSRLNKRLQTKAKFCGTERLLKMFDNITLTIVQLPSQTIRICSR